MHLPTLFERLDPRNSLAAAAGWLIVAVSFGLALAASAWVSAVASEDLLEQKHKQLNQYAERLSSELDITLYAHLQSVRTTAAMLGATPGRTAARTPVQFLEELRRTLPEFAWVAFADTSGRVRATSGALLEAQNVADRPWFAHGLKAPWAGVVQEATPLDGLFPRTSNRAPTRFIHLTVPVLNAEAVTVGVVGAQLTWRWVEKLKHNLDLATHPTGVVDTAILDRDGVVLLGPAALVGKVWTHADRLEYVEASSTDQGFGSFTGPGWTIWVREPRTHALARVARLRIEIFAILFGLGLLAALLGAWGTRRVLRRIGSVAALADAVRAGHVQPVLLPGGRDEAARIGHTLTGLVAELQREKAELQALNAELDARVAARTREVERLSEENKYAAVVRERLRIARELHDTLAHSMMAMLTEIRLLRKLADVDPAALKDELANAELAAQIGLNEARAAISQMRYNAVRDIGLGASVSALVQRFAEKTGIVVDYSSDARAAELADARAETLFRMVEEIFRNAERHACAQRMCVALRHDLSSRALVISIADDGVGFDPRAQTPGHYGLRGLHEQAALIGAVLQIESAPQPGTRITLTLPFPPGP